MHNDKLKEESNFEKDCKKDLEELTMIMNCPNNIVPYEDYQAQEDWNFLQRLKKINNHMK